MAIDYQILNDYDLTEIDSRWIMNLRERLNLSKTDFGALFGVKHSQVYNWEVKGASPSLSAKMQMLALAKRSKELGPDKTSQQLKGLLVAGGFAVAFLWLMGVFDN